MTAQLQSLETGVLGLNPAIVLIAVLVLTLAGVVARVAFA
jgi:hypothetical protein